MGFSRNHLSASCVQTAMDMLRQSVLTVELLDTCAKDYCNSPCALDGVKTPAKYCRNRLSPLLANAHPGRGGADSLQTMAAWSCKKRILTYRRTASAISVRLQTSSSKCVQQGRHAMRASWSAVLPRHSSRRSEVE